MVAHKNGNPWDKMPKNYLPQTEVSDFLKR